AYVQINEETKRTIRGAERKNETVVGDYKEEGGVMMPHSIESKPKGAPQGQKLTIDKFDINPDIPDSYLQAPAATATPPPRKKKEPEKEPENPQKKKTETPKPKQ